jgi:hypothetical protein
VPYAALLRAWQGDRGGCDPASAYVGLVEAGLAQPRASPFRGRSAAERGSSGSCGPAPERSSPTRPRPRRDHSLRWIRTSSVLRWSITAVWTDRRCCVAMILIWPVRWPPGSTGGTPTQRCGNWPCGCASPARPACRISRGGWRPAWRIVPAWGVSWQRSCGRRWRSPLRRRCRGRSGAASRLGKTRPRLRLPRPKRLGQKGKNKGRPRSQHR